MWLFIPRQQAHHISAVFLPGKKQLAENGAREAIFSNS
jgi:hypothetical protein